MGLFIDYFYGYTTDPCDNRVYALVDPILPPKKCLLNCTYCPVGCGIPVSRDYSLTANLELFRQHLGQKTELIRGGEALFIWGMGDPLLISNINSIVGTVRELIGEREIVVYSSGFSLSRLLGQKALNDVKEVRAPLTLLFDETNHGISPRGYVELLKLFSREHGDKIVVEVVAFKIGYRYVPQIDALRTTLSKINVGALFKVRIKTLERPGCVLDAKPVPERYLEQLKEAIEELGGKVVTCRQVRQKRPQVPVKPLINTLYNQLIRIPLSTDEIISIYGETGIIAATNLLENKYAEQVPWEGKIFYRGHY